MTEEKSEMCDPSAMVEVKIVSCDNDESPWKNQNEIQTLSPPAKPKHIPRRKKRILHCSTCNYTAKTRKSFSRHNLSKCHAIKMDKAKHKDKNCNMCKVKTMEDVTKCPQCDYKSDNIRSLKLHMSIHNKGLPFKCESCKFAAQNIKLLIEHYKSVTKYCTKGNCSFSAHTDEELKKHKKICTW